MVSEDEDFLVIARRWLMEGRSFAGLVYGRQLKYDIGRATEDLVLITECYAPEEIANRVIYVPM